jgi:hypothetical protein
MLAISGYVTSNVWISSEYLGTTCGDAVFFVIFLSLSLSLSFSLYDGT